MQNIMPFQHYLDMDLAKQCSKDPVTAKTIFTRATKRLEYVKSQEVDQDDAPFIFEDIYEVIRECAQSLMTRDGFKPYSHEAIIAFTIDRYREKFGDKLINTFDRYRVIRNNSMYRANIVSEEEASKALSIANDFVNITKDILLSGF
jgi:uncharacterized protein (UPF0332 family)